MPSKGADAVERLVDTVLMARASVKRSADSADVYGAAVRDVYGDEWRTSFSKRLASRVMLAKLGSPDPVAAVTEAASRFCGEMLLHELRAAAAVVSLLSQTIAAHTGVSVAAVLREVVDGARLSEDPMTTERSDDKDCKRSDER